MPINIKGWLFYHFKLKRLIYYLILLNGYVIWLASDFFQIKSTMLFGAAIAQWIYLRLPSCGPGFDPPSTTSTLFQFIFELDKNKQKEAGIGPFFLKKRVPCYRSLETVQAPVPLYKNTINQGNWCLSIKIR